MTHRNGIRLLALSILLAGCLESEPPRTDGDGEPQPTGSAAKIDPTKDKPITNSIGMELKLVPAGTFMMGSDAGIAPPNERPVRKVTLTKPFYIGLHEVTQEQYEKVMGENPSESKGPQNPVTHVNWADAVRFCETLSDLPEEKAAGRTYRLPTEAEWEYACRAGTTTRFSFGNEWSQLGEYAWLEDNSDDMTHVVGQKKPNAWGLYDVHGNVDEWCQDRFKDYRGDTVVDPDGSAEGSYRVARGGSWSGPAWFCRSSFRVRLDPTARVNVLGFRLAAVPSSK